MSRERYQTAKEIFLAACLKPESEQAEFVRTSCGGDDELLAEVRALLALDATPESHSETRAEPWEQQTTLANYRLLGQVGRGGMGLVYEAEQLRPVKRRVALKLIKPGMDSRRVLARFESERQALARMDHSNIARVYDAGLTDQKRPFVAMEFVKGVPIDEYCDSHQLTIEQRLKLFVDVCAGVQHAHQKGVIHRDLKPSNVLVTVEGVAAIPKIIDFGVAKAIAEPLSTETVYTEMGQIIGTPEFMSPEQVERTGLDIDTRSDVYALGVLLYQLLVGETPFARSNLREQAFSEVCRILREQDPLRPSTQVTATPSEVAQRARARRSQPSLWRRQLQGDIDWIILRALEKDRTRRYSSASEFAEDIQRHLRDEPVLAGPPSWSYRARKFIRRNRPAVAASVLMLATLVIALIATSVSRNRAIDAEQLATQSAQEARQAEALAKSAAEESHAAESRALQAEANALAQAAAARSAEQKARDQAESARQVAGFLIAVYRASDPRVAQSRELTAREVLDRNVKVLLAREFEQPQVKASLLVALGQVYHSLGVVQTAEELLAEGLELRRQHDDAGSREFHEALLGLASVSHDRGNFDRSETLCREVLNSFVEGTSAPLLLNRAKLQLGHTLRMSGKLSESEEWARAALQGFEALTGVESTEVADASHLVGEILTDQQRFAEAEPLARQALDLRRRLLGETHPTYSSSLQAVGMLLKEMGKFSDAQRMVERSLELDRASLGNDHPEINGALYNLGSILNSAGKYAEAEPVLREVLRLDRKQLGKHLFVTLSMQTLASALTNQGKFIEAEQLYKEALKMQQELFDGPHAEIASTLNNYGRLLSQCRRSAEAEALDRQALDIRRQVFGEESPHVASSLNALAVQVQSQGRVEEGMTLLEEALAIRRKHFEHGHSSIATTLCAMADNRVRTKDYLRAKQFALEAVTVHRQFLPPGHVEGAHSLVVLSRALLGLEEYEEAVVAAREGLEIRKTQLPQDHKHVLYAQELLARALTFLKRFDEAEPLLKSAFEAATEKYGDADRLTQGLRDDLAELYELWGKPIQAREVRGVGS